VRYLHSDIDTMERVKILRTFASGRSTFWSDHLLREGLDLPESPGGILDADKEGFLRSARCSCRRSDGPRAMFPEGSSSTRPGDRVMRRRCRDGPPEERQIAYNKEHGSTPETIRR